MFGKIICAGDTFVHDNGEMCVCMGFEGKVMLYRFEEDWTNTIYKM